MLLQIKLFVFVSGFESNQEKKVLAVCQKRKRKEPARSWNWDKSKIDYKDSKKVPFDKKKIVKMSKTKSQPAKSRKRQARFSVKERVLCYEPDLSKARVVYDAKILKVECPDMSKKKKAKEFHYLVHFQG